MNDRAENHGGSVRLRRAVLFDIPFPAASRRQSDCSRLLPALFKHLSVADMAALFCLGALTVAWLGVVLCHGVARQWVHGRRNANEMIGLTLTAFSTLYSILLALLAVEAYQNFSAVGATVSKQAQTIAALHQDFEGLPQPIRDNLQNALRDYSREAIDTVHPPPDVPQNPHSASTTLKVIFSEIMNFQPKLKSEEMVQTEIFSKLNTLLEQRRSIVAAGGGGLPSELWDVVCLGGVLFLTLICLFDMDLRVHLILSGALALFLGAVVFLIAALDNPFNGGLTVSSAPIESVLATISR